MGGDPRFAGSRTILQGARDEHRPEDGRHHGQKEHHRGAIPVRFSGSLMTRDGLIDLTMLNYGLPFAIREAGCAPLESK